MSSPSTILRNLREEALKLLWKDNCTFAHLGVCLRMSDASVRAMAKRLKLGKRKLHPLEMKH